jgi:hypothetical protein
VENVRAHLHSIKGDREITVAFVALIAAPCGLDFADRGTAASLWLMDGAHRPVTCACTGSLDACNQRLDAADADLAARIRAGAIDAIVSISSDAK